MYQYLALVHAGEGRWRDANASLSALRHTPGSAAWLMRALLAALPFLDVPKTDLEKIRRELEGWDPRADPPEAESAPEAALGAHLRLWLLARLDVRLSADARALERAAELERLDVSPALRPTVRSMAQTIRAEVLTRQGRMREALDALAPVQGEVPLALVNVPFYAEEPARWLRIQLLRSLGREDEALEWMRNGFAATPTELAYLAPLHREQAQIYDRLGDHARATEHYARFVRLWKACDPALRPAVDDARERLAQLVGEPR
jgi:tetratricopeptide (TPR) repeat protein